MKDYNQHTELNEFNTIILVDFGFISTFQYPHTKLHCNYLLGVSVRDRHFSNHIMYSQLARTHRSMQCNDQTNILRVRRSLYEPICT